MTRLSTICALLETARSSQRISFLDNSSRSVESKAEAPLGASFSSTSMDQENSEYGDRRPSYCSNLSPECLLSIRICSDNLKSVVEVEFHCALMYESLHYCSLNLDYIS